VSRERIPQALVSVLAGRHGKSRPQRSLEQFEVDVELERFLHPDTAPVGKQQPGGFVAK
jgi:hypothetical protein